MNNSQWNEKQVSVYESAKAQCGFTETGESLGKVLEQKGRHSQICFEKLKEQLGFNTVSPVVFCSDSSRFQEMLDACFVDRTYPDAMLDFFTQQRLMAVLRLYQEEKVLQTAPIAAVLAAAANQLVEISELAGLDVNKEEPIYCDVAYAGVQAVRLYFASTFDPTFLQMRAKSTVQVNNALNGVFYKYETKDGRGFSFHNYYESQKIKMLNALKFGKAPEKVDMTSIAEDRAAVAEIVKTYNAEDLEDLAFDCGSTGCVIRDRDEWESTDVGRAVTNMPLLNINKYSDENGLKNKKLGGPKGPLQGLKVLDFTHIIAGPACTRMLAENGADVLLVRRQPLIGQEQSCTELDGWAGKRAIDLDLENPESLARAKELIKEADVVVYSYQNNAFERFGLSRDEFLKINPNLIFSSMMCFSETEWKNRPGWAPLAEDITGLSIRNGTKEALKNLNGVPLDYIPGLVLALGTLEAIKRSMRDGGGYTVLTSLTRGAVWLHECTDLCNAQFDGELSAGFADESPDFKEWSSMTHRIKDNSTGEVGFPSPACASKNLPDVVANMKFLDGQTGFLD